MGGYYTQRLAGEGLRRCYELAPPRVQQYLRAEVDFVVARLRPTDLVVDLGCGYGRAMPAFARAAHLVVGVDTSEPSLDLARQYLHGLPNCLLMLADAARLPYVDESFDATICIQNGISAFHVDQGLLVREALRVTRSDGIVYFSTYSDAFWPYRLDWFQRQAAAGLVGELDLDQCRDGVIVGKDGFRATTVRAPEFRALVDAVAVDLDMVEVDGSSVFYVLSK
jgi:2-polyprenyl-6-hydroxyphenyl methylase/3-demethylubiquinone-9 3-methyltransferase